MKINLNKVRKAIIASEKFIADSKSKDKFSETGGLTIYGCECRNLQEYREILNFTDTKELDQRLLELYKAV